MRVLADRECLTSAVQAVATVAPGRTLKPILQGIALTAGPEGTYAAATDLEVWVRLGVLGVKVDRPGAAVLPARFLEALRFATDDDEVAVEIDGGGALTLTGHRSVYRMPTQSIDDWPSVSSLETSEGCCVTHRDLCRAIRRTVHATDPNSLRYALGGLSLELDSHGGVLTIVATDGRRLATQKIAAEFGRPQWPDQVVLPEKAAKLIVRLLDENSDELVSLRADAERVTVEFGRTQVVSRQKEGRFPNWRAVVPANLGVVAHFNDAASLLRLAERAAVMTSRESQGVDLTFGDSEATAVAATADAGESEASCDCETHSGSLKAALDFHCLRDMLRGLTGYPLDIAGAGPKSAVSLVTDDGFSGIIMPLNPDR